MAPRREEDDKNDDWKKTRGRDVESFGKWIIGVLLIIIGFFATNKLNNIENIGLKNQEAIAGYLREGQSRDSTIAFLRRDVQEHIVKHSIVWTKEEWEAWQAAKTEIYRKWGYLSTTRSGHGTLVNEPLKE
jgi:hypothetical protein